MKKFRKSILLLLCLTLVSSVFSVKTQAEESSNDILNQNIDQALVTKADPYVYLDPKSETFKLKNEANDKLNKKEIKEVKSILKTSNKQVKQFRHDLIIDTKNNKFDANIKEKETSDIGSQAIDKSKNFDWDFTWWGLKVYWSHAFVEKLKDNLVIYGGSVAALTATISYFLTPPGWVSSFIAAVAGIGVGVFINRDKGCGVYLDCYLYVPTAWYSAC